MYEESGYIDVGYIPDVEIDDGAKTCAFTFDVLQGRRYTVGAVAARPPVAGSLP
jgi:outer membrane protein assembly factor BamA